MDSINKTKAEQENFMLNKALMMIELIIWSFTGGGETEKTPSFCKTTHQQSGNKKGKQCYETI